MDESSAESLAGQILHYMTQELHFVMGIQGTHLQKQQHSNETRQRRDGSLNGMYAHTIKTYVTN